MANACRVVYWWRMACMPSRNVTSEMYNGWA